MSGSRLQLLLAILPVLLLLLVRGMGKVVAGVCRAVCPTHTPTHLVQNGILVTQLALLGVA
jgi:hypothetical protein